MASPGGPAVVDPAQAAETTTAASVARSSAWNLAATVLPQAYLVAVSIAAARFLGPDSFGRQSFIAFVELSLVTMFSTGLAAAVSRFVGASLGSREPGYVLALARVAARVFWPASALAAVILLVAGLLGATPAGAWFFAAAFAAVSILQRGSNAVLTGFQRWREVTLGGLAVGAVATVAVIAVLAFGGGITGIFAVEAGTGAVFLVWTAVLARRALRSLARGPAEGAPKRRMLRYAGISTIGVVLTLVVWRRSEFLFLNHYSSDAEIGFYSIAFAAAAAVLLVPLAVTGVLLPSIATLHGADQAHRIRWAYTRAGRLLVIASLPLIAAGIALGPTLIELVYGRSYDEAGTLLIILLLPAPVVVVGNLAGVLLAAIERLLFPIVVGTIAAVFNIVLDFLLIPRYDSVGAAIANSTAQLVSSLPALFYVRRLLGEGDWKAGAIARAAIASVASGVVAWACIMLVGGAAGFIIGLVFGSAVFFALARVLRMLSADDAEWLETAVGGVLGGKIGRAVRFCGPAPPKAV